VDKLRGFAVPTAQDSPYVMRLAAYASDGTALEYVNLATRFGADWFPQGGGPVSGCPADMDCVLEDLDPGLIADVIREPNRVVVLVWPEVSEFEVSGPSALNRDGLSGDGPLDAQLTLSAFAGANSVVVKTPRP
jgi:hypothetical protein